MPVVSVVLPVYNAANTVVRAVRSILDQTLRDIELIVIDDGSTDGTPGLLDQIADTRLRTFSNPHRGVARSANTGTEMATAATIARMDADDFSYPSRLEKQLALLEHNDLDVVGCQVRIVNAQQMPVPSLDRYARWINEETISSEQIRALRFVEFPIVNPTILARRSFFELGFQDNGYPEDYDLMLRAAEQGLKFGKVREVLFEWSDLPARLTRNDPRYSRPAFLKCRQHYLLSGPLRDVSQVDLWGVGKSGKPWLRWLQTQQINTRQAYDIDPRKIGSRIHGVPVRAPKDLAPPDGTPLLIAVGADHARQQILPQIQALGYESGQNAWFVS